MQVDYISVAPAWARSRSRRKLERRLGAAGVCALVDLWLSVAAEHPSGDLLGYKASDLAKDAGWAGDVKQFERDLLDTGFIERLEGGGYHLVHVLNADGVMCFGRSREELA